MDASDVEGERQLARIFVERMIVNGYCARQSYRLFKRQGLLDVSADVCGLHFTDYVLARQMWLMDDVEREALAAGVVTARQLDQLHTFWERADAEGVYFTSVHMTLVSGRKP